MQTTPHDPLGSNQDPEFSAPEGKILLSVEEACQRLSVGKTTMFALIKANKIRSVKIGSARRVVAESLRTFVADQLADAS